ncbi:MAG: hypothetical protein K6T65_14645 [Peptococcaceae bacterium]|nr:hypothetical protein [Peptococcaceae bacterium]
MKTIYEGATCDVCYNKAAKSKKVCRPCLTRNGRPAFIPAVGVEVRESQGYTFDGKGRPVPTIFRKVCV